VERPRRRRHYQKAHPKGNTTRALSRFEVWRGKIRVQKTAKINQKQRGKRNSLADSLGTRSLRREAHSAKGKEKRGHKTLSKKKRD